MITALQCVRQRRGARRGEQFLGEERVPLRARPDGIEEHRTGRATGPIRDQGGHVGAVEPTEVELGHARVSAEFGEPGRQRMIAIEVLGAVGANDQRPGVAEATGEEVKKLSAARICPLQVLEHEHDRRRLGDIDECPQDRLEEHRLAERTPYRSGHGVRTARLCRGRLEFGIGPERAE